MSSLNLIKKLRDLYFGPKGVTNILEDSDIVVLKDFLTNWDIVEQFYNRYYKTPYPKTVICGINPGKNGAGKTGIPFLDFSSVSKLLDSINKSDTERSAQFFYDVIKDIGIEKFFNSFYVTNISWVGYMREHKNLNYYDLPQEIQNFILNAFQYEMKIVSPTTIISLSQEVRSTIGKLYEGRTIEVDQYLPHPNYCAFPSNYQKCKKQYVDLLSRYIV